MSNFVFRYSEIFHNIVTAWSMVLLCVTTLKQRMKGIQTNRSVTCAKTACKVALFGDRCTQLQFWLSVPPTQMSTLCSLLRMEAVSGSFTSNFKLKLGMYFQFLTRLFQGKYGRTGRQKGRRAEGHSYVH